MTHIKKNLKKEIQFANIIFSPILWAIFGFFLIIFKPIVSGTVGIQ